MVTDALGPDRGTWPVDVAVAMPVEMIESWVLLLCDPQRPTLPLFAEAIQSSALAYCGATPPPQLKDLCKAEAAAIQKPLDEYFWHAAEQDIEATIAVSPSFRMFVEELRQWRRAPVDWHNWNWGLIFPGREALQRAGASDVDAYFFTDAAGVGRGIGSEENSVLIPRRCMSKNCCTR